MEGWGEKHDVSDPPLLRLTLNREDDRPIVNREERGLVQAQPSR